MAMISKSEWQNTYRRSRNRVDPPPTFEEVDALHSGNLPEAEADRIRDRLAQYPELARVMSAPFPEVGELTQEEIDADLAALRKRMPVPMPDRRSSPRVLAVAALLIVTVAIAGIVVWLAERTSQRTTTTRVLYADGHRGAGSQTPIQLSTETDYMLKPVFRPGHAYREYRLDLLDGRGTTIWSRSGLHREADGSYPVEVSTKALSPGLYQLVLYGADGAAPDRLASYTIRVYVP